MKNSCDIKYLTSYETRELYNIILEDRSLHAIRNRAIFLLGKYCALRVSEISLIQIADYNPYDHSILCKRLKGSKSNLLKIVDPDVLKALEKYLFYRNKMDTFSNCLFVSQHGHPISRQMLDVIMKKYCLLTTIPTNKHHFHVLKHTRAMELIDYDGVELREVQYWLGHKSISNTMIYLDFSLKQRNNLFLKIAGKEGNGSLIRKGGFG